MLLWETLVLVAYGLCAGALSLFGLHRLHLSQLFWRSWPNKPQASVPQDWPTVTVQLPVFNERAVVERLIDAACALDYPSEKLEIQVLDDSTDDTTERAARAVARWAAQGIDITLIHREDRSGFKAGALQKGLAQAKGTLIAVFDADFVPQASFLRDAVPHFAEGVGMVQARWGHINETDSLLTKLQGMMLDGHFVVEHTARHRNGRWFNFNGTAGIWHRQAIADAGGWQHDTLTEDLDLSYRAQLFGWRFIYLPDLVVPAELPPTLRAFKSQQHRWAKGSIETMLKLGPRLLRASIPWRVKLEALVHLSNNLAYPMVILLTLLTPIAVFVRGRQVNVWLVADVFFFTAATVGVAVFYASSQRAVYVDWRRRLWRLPAVMGLGIGMAVNQSRAVFEALMGQQSPFVRTPKAGDDGALSYSMPGHWTAWIEAFLALYHLAGLVLAVTYGYWPSLAIQLLFCLGFGGVAFRTLRPAPTVAAARRAA